MKGPPAEEIRLANCKIPGLPTAFIQDTKAGVNIPRFAFLIGHRVPGRRRVPPPSLERELDEALALRSCLIQPSEVKKGFSRPKEPRHPQTGVLGLLHDEVKI